MKKHTIRTLRGFKTSTLELLGAPKAALEEAFLPIGVLLYELLKHLFLKCKYRQTKKNLYLKKNSSPSNQREG
jgi:hypothetical protein